LLIFLILLAFCAVGCELLSLRRGLKGVSYTCRPSVSVVEPGEEFELETVISNNKWTPVSFLEVVQALPHDIQLNAYLGRFRSEPVVSWLYSTCYLGSRQRLTRRVKASLPQRGRRLISDAQITAGDLLGLRRRSQTVSVFHEIVALPRRTAAPDLSQALGGFLGEVSVRRFILEDPMLTVGARDYTGREPMKAVSWKHSLRAGKLMVKEFDYTVENFVTVVLNAEGGEPETLERCFSLARMAVEQLEARGLSYGFLTNAATAGAIGRWSEVSAGLGAGHARAILEGMGRATYDVQEPFETLALRAARRSEQGRAHIIVTPGRLQETDPALAPLRRQSDGRIFILSALDLPAEPEGRGPEEEAAV